jgi:hypothetical protein
MISALDSEGRNEKLHMSIHISGHLSESRILTISILHGTIQEFSMTLGS